MKSRARWRLLMQASILFSIVCAVAASCTKEPEVSEEVEHYLAAQEALARGDTETALKELDATIQIRPDSWAYYERAKIYNELGKEEQALADCKAGLALSPDHAELKWLSRELDKPANRRFKGRNSAPPKAAK